ncbi:MAG: GTPase Era [Gemmatimonadales bacterium]
MPRAGTVTIAGRPNAGKSTLLNRLVGQRLAITSPKPQSTRERVVGLITDDDSQIILLDTPGLLEPAYELQKSMRAASLEALDDADVIIHLIDALEGHPETLAAAAGLTAGMVPRAATITAFNKADALSAARRAALVNENPGAVVVSALTGDGVSALLDRVRALLPEHPFYYDADDLSTQNMRFFAAEMIRETALEQLEDEVPYSIACEVEEFRETRSPVYIRAVLHVERDSQKRILIGAGGSRIKSIGTRARGKIETLLRSPVYLDLHVKVLPNWRRDSAALRRLGYRVD